jgi:hypothetical protein
MRTDAGDLCNTLNVAVPRPRGWRLALLIVGVGVFLANATAIVTNVATSDPMPTWLAWLGGGKAWWILSLLTLVGAGLAIWAVRSSPSVTEVSASATKPPSIQAQRLVLEHSVTNPSGSIIRIKIFDQSVASRFVDTQVMRAQLEEEEEE